MRRKAHQNAQPIRLWGRWITKAEDHISSSSTPLSQKQESAAALSRLIAVLLLYYYYLHWLQVKLRCYFAPTLTLLKSCIKWVTVGTGRTWLSCFCKLPHADFLRVHDSVHKGLEEVSWWHLLVINSVTTVHLFTPSPVTDSIQRNVSKDGLFNTVWVWKVHICSFQWTTVDEWWFMLKLMGGKPRKNLRLWINSVIFFFSPNDLVVDCFWQMGDLRTSLCRQTL